MMGTRTEPKIQLDVEIVVATDGHAQFFFELEEQTTWDSLPADKKNISRAEFHERLQQLHGQLLAQPGHTIFIAQNAQSGENLGLLWFGPRFNPITCEDEGWIFNVTVLPQHQGCGIAKKLMRHAEIHAQNLGLSTIGLAVSCHNEGARAVYERLGYDQSNILMRKVLTPGE